MTLDEVKKLIHVDFSDDDEYINLLIDVAKEYIADSVGSFDENKARHRLLLITIVSTLYENRVYTIDKNNEKVLYVIKSMVTQLQLDEVE